MLCFVVGTVQNLFKAHGIGMCSEHGVFVGVSGEAHGTGSNLYDSMFTSCLDYSNWLRDVHNILRVIKYV